MLSKERSETRWLNTVSLVIIAAVAVALALIYTRKVMIPFVLALFTVSMVSPIQDLLVLRLRFHRSVSVFVSLMVALMFMLLIGSLFFSAVNTVITTVVSSTQTEEVATPSPPPSRTESDLGVDEDGDEVIIDEETERRFQDYFYHKMLTLLNPTLTWLNKKYPQIIGDEQAYDIIVLFERLAREMGKRLFNLLGNALGSVLGAFSSAMFVTIFTIFLLSGRNPHVIRQGVAAEVDHKIRRYIVTKVAISAVTGILVWVSLRLIGLELASVFGILAFLLNFIPSIGSIISTMLPIPLALAQFGMGLPSALVLLIPGSIQMLMGNVLEPKLMGEGLNLHPVTILLALAFWGLLWGIVGMFLAAPMTAVVRIVFMQFDTLRPLGELLAGKLPESLQRDSDS